MTLDTANALTAVSTFTSVVGAATDDANTITLLINQASAWFNRTVGYPVKARTVTEYQDGDAGVVMYLRVIPCASVLLYCDSTRQFGSDTLLTQDTDYVLEEETGRIILISGSFPPGPGTVKAVYTGGFDSNDSESALLEGACIELVRYWYDMIRNARIGLKSQSVAGGTTSYINDIPDDVKAIAESLRRVDGIG